MCVRFWGEWYLYLYYVFVVISISPITVCLLAANFGLETAKTKKQWSMSKQVHLFPRDAIKFVMLEGTLLKIDNMYLTRFTFYTFVFSALSQN